MNEISAHLELLAVRTGSGSSRQNGIIGNRHKRVARSRVAKDLKGNGASG